MFILFSIDFFNMETVKDYIDNNATLPLVLEWAEEIFGENNVEFQLEKNIEFPAK